MKTKENYLKEMNEQGYSSDYIDDFHRFIIPYLLSKNNINKNDSICEVGIAEGHCLISAHKAGFRNLKAIDYIDINFQRFERNYNITCNIVDLIKDNFPFDDESINAYIYFHTIEHLPDSMHALSEIYRTLKKGGVCLIATPDWEKQKNSFYDDPTHVKPYNKIGMGRLLRIMGWRDIKVNSFGTAFGLGRLKSYRFIDKTAFMGNDIIAIAKK